jgi:hypothetical protein
MGRGERDGIALTLLTFDDQAGQGRSERNDRSKIGQHMSERDAEIRRSSGRQRMKLTIFWAAQSAMPR